MPGDRITVREASAGVRKAFVRTLVLHLALAVVAFVLVEATLLSLISAEMVLEWMKRGPLLLASATLFFAASWLARRWAEAESATWRQYAGIGVYVLLQSVALLPFIRLAGYVDERALLMGAALLVALVIGLLLAAWRMKRDITALGCLFYILAPLAAVAAIFGSVQNTFAAPLLVGAALVAVLVSVLSETQRAFTYHCADQPVAAALSLSAAITLPIQMPMVLLLRVVRCRD